ncbi:MAG: hypothetical protein LUO85_01115 [Methanomassiliicoccales archaeon]|nr:hypothetical protein [Methanomassiliicoccales archaeon]
MSEWSAGGGLIFISSPSYLLGPHFHTTKRIGLFRWLAILLSVLILLLGYLILSTFAQNANFDIIWMFILSAGLVFFLSEDFYRSSMVSAYPFELRQNGIMLYAFPWNKFHGEMKLIPYQDLTKVVAYHHGTGPKWNRRPRIISAIKLHPNGNVRLDVGIRRNDYDEILRILGEQQGVPIIYKLMQTG